MKNGDTDTISDALKMFGDQDSAAKWFGHLNTKSDGSSIISDGIIDIFQGAFKNIDADAVKKNIAKGAKAESSSLGDILSDGIGNLVGGVTSFGSGISAVLGSVAQFAIPLILGGLAIHAGKSLWNNVLTNNNANKKYEESSQKYDNAVSERDSLQSEYNTNKERYYELNAKENRSTDEQTELENLASKNSLMESQLKVKDNLVDATQKQQALDAKDALEKSGLRTDKTSAHWYENGLLRGKTGVKYQDDIDEANDMIEKLNMKRLYSDTETIEDIHAINEALVRADVKETTIVSPGASGRQGDIRCLGDTVTTLDGRQMSFENAIKDMLQGMILKKIN